MKQAITDFFKGMKVLEIIEFSLLALLIVILPWSWKWAVKVFIPLVIVMTARIIAFRKLGNPTLTKLGRWGLLMMMGLYLFQVVSLIYTENMEEGLDFLVTRLSLLLLPACLLATNMSYMDRKRRNAMVYIFTIGLALRFFYRMAEILITGGTLKIDGFDTLHHTYTAMYILLPLGFLYNEWTSLPPKKGILPDERKKRARKCWFIAILAVIMMTYIVFVGSRTGIAGVIVLFAAIVLHQIAVLHNVKVGLGILLAGVLLAGSVFFVMPESSRRLTKTVGQMSQGNTSDIRFLIYESSIRASVDNLPFGTGIGDGKDVITTYYEAEGKEMDLNSHNIYLDSFLTLGIPGLLLLLAMFALPVIDSVRRKDYCFLTFLFAVSFSGLFEAVISRQMGLLFMFPFWTILSGQQCHESLPCAEETDPQ